MSEKAPQVCVFVTGKDLPVEARAGLIRFKQHNGANPPGHLFAQPKQLRVCIRESGSERLPENRVVLELCAYLGDDHLERCHA